MLTKQVLMAIPKNISKEHLLKAISKIDEEGIPKDGDSQYYDVVYNGKKYPPKVVVSYANIFANGKELDRNSFSGGLETQCIKLLQENKFIIQKKSVLHYVLGASWQGNENGSDQSERFIENGIWENGYDDKFLEVVNGVNVGDRVAIKSSYATREGKSMLRVKATGTVYENNGDGKTLKITWDKRFNPFDLEGFGGYRNTIQKVSDQDIDAIFKSGTNMNYYPEVKKFLAQAKTTELGTSNYINKFQGLSVKVSFGKGNQARVPWIAFLNEIDSVQEGIYPVYLYYKDKYLLILAYGLSETHPSNRMWDISNVKTIDQYFADNRLGNPDRYGSSYVYKSYDTNTAIVEEEINNDLNKLLSIYKSTVGNSKENPKTMEDFKHKSFYSATSKAGYFINEKLSTRFISSLITKPFVILTGLSGSGKTKLAQAFAKWICENDSQYKIIPVGADWTNREPLFGYPNALESEKYILPDNGTLSLILEAQKEKNEAKPYFLILDEMNLSHVERYFADFLSAMESGEAIPLHNGGGDWHGVPSSIKLPKNLFVIGTVNIDETTYMFSPKVLDRANVIEFRVTKEEMSNYLDSATKLDLDSLTANGATMGASFVAIANDRSLTAKNKNELNEELLKFFIELKKSGAEFGYRSASEMNRFAAVVNELEPTWAQWQIVDAAIMQKLLPKVHGSRKKLEPVLKKLGELCLHDTSVFSDYIKDGSESISLEKIKYPISMEKIGRMYRALLENSFTSYAEA
jgi:5-methylcytosine-specific restriction enzyme B